MHFLFLSWNCNQNPISGVFFIQPHFGIYSYFINYFSPSYSLLYLLPCSCLSLIASFIETFWGICMRVFSLIVRCFRSMGGKQTLKQILNLFKNKLCPIVPWKQISFFSREEKGARRYLKAAFCIMWWRPFCQPFCFAGINILPNS